MLEVTELFSVIDKGVTMPIHARLSDGTVAVVKYPNNPCGTSTLINEWIGNNIARKIGVTIPNYGLCYLDSDMIYTRIDIDILDESNTGICFYSEYMSKAVPLPSKRNVINYEAERIILLDHILNNFDRHEGNLFYDVNTSILYAIDYSHLFSNSGLRLDYDSDDIKRGMDPDRYLYTDILEKNSRTYDVICFSAGFDEKVVRKKSAEIKDIITHSYLTDLFNDLPEEWIKAVGQEKVYRLIEFIEFRVTNIERIADMIVKERQR